MSSSLSKQLQLPSRWRRDADRVVRRSVAASAESRRAFTMIEMLLVLVLLVTTASLALPAFTALLSRSDDQQAVALVRNTLQAVRQLAIDSGTAQQWHPEMVVNGADDVTAAEGGNAKSGKLKRGYSIDLNATQPITFQPTGCARDGRIVIQGPRGEVAVLLVVGATGSILNEDASR